jgi:hypothetical protein
MVKTLFGKLSTIALLSLIMISSLSILTPRVMADTFNQIPLWINIMEGAEMSSDLKDEIEKGIDDIFKQNGLNWRVTSVVLAENASDPDKSNDEPGDVREGAEEDGLYTKGKRETKDLGGFKIFVVKRILNGTGGDAGYLGGAKEHTRTAVVSTNSSGVDWATIWAHEMGHLFGLRHKNSDGSNRTQDNLLYPFYPMGKNLTAEDIAQMNTTKIERDLGLPKLTEDQMYRDYNMFHTVGEDLYGDSFYPFMDIQDVYFSFYILDETRELHITSFLGDLLPLGFGFTYSIALNTDNNPMTGGEYHGWEGVDFLIQVDGAAPNTMAMLYKYPEGIPIMPLDSRIDTEFMHRSKLGPPEIPPTPILDSIVVSIPLGLLPPLSDPIAVGAYMQSADGLATDRLEQMLVPTSPPDRPTFDLAPCVAPAGTLVTATGEGYAPGEKVSIIFAHDNLSTVDVEPDGSFSTTFAVPDLDPYYYMVDAIDDAHNVGLCVFTLTPTQDVAVDDVYPSKTIVGLGYCMDVNVTVSNKGDSLETFNVSVYANDTFVTSQNVTLSIGESAEVRFIWNTTGLVKGSYNISAYAWPLLNETETIDNLLFGDIVLVGVPCDVTGPTPGVPEGICDMRDIAYFCARFLTTPASPNWDPNVDVTGPTARVPDDRVDMRDIADACSHFLEIDP